MIASDIGSIVSGARGSKDVNIEIPVGISIYTDIETTLSVIFGFLKKEIY